MRAEANEEQGQANNPYVTHPAMITDILQETAETKTYTFEFAKQERSFVFIPGQFNMISLPGFGEGPFSIASSPLQKGTFKHTIRTAGSLTRQINRLNIGDIVGVRGPYGRGWPVNLAKDKDLLIIAGGIGLAPFRGLIDMIIEQRDGFGEVEIMYGSRKPENLIFTRDYDSWRSASNIRLFLTVDEVPKGVEWPYEQGVVTNLLNFSKIDPANALALICGPEIMMRFIVRSLLIRGFAEGNIFVSMERRMECGMAKCGRCMIGPKYVCTDGPVFSYGDAKTLPHNLLTAIL
ncbi:MAG: FAD/NAD(P)-binding protein [Firmicutes bacterium]|nr:FAD/NAD(P)-binding protein [Bacillota bacterium]